MDRAYRLGGLLASLILIAFGTGAIVMGIAGRSEVRDKIELEQVAGTPDMTPAAAAEQAREAGLTNADIPECSVAGETVDNGDKAKCFAEYMRLHALEATGGKTYAQMPRFATEDGRGTNEASEAQKRPDGSPTDNPARNIWITETALSTAMNTSYFAEQVGLFAIIMGTALLLTGLGFLVLTFGLRRRNDTAVPPPG